MRRLEKHGATLLGLGFSSLYYYNTLMPVCMLKELLVPAITPEVNMRLQHGKIKWASSKVSLFSTKVFVFPQTDHLIAVLCYNAITVFTVHDFVSMFLNLTSSRRPPALLFLFVSRSP